MPVASVPDHRPALLYDDTCGLCDAGARRLVRASGGRARLVASHSDEAVRLLPELSNDEFERQMYLVAGERVYGGAEAMARTLALNPWLRIALLYYVPGIRGLCDAGYRRLAARRHRLSEACRLK